MNKDEYIKFLEAACRDIYEVWAGSEGIPMPETAPEGYLLFLVEQMRDIAKRALDNPPQREWQGLTDKEIENCFEMSMFGTCRAIEAMLKEKNSD